MGNYSLTFARQSSACLLLCDTLLRSDMTPRAIILLLLLITGAMARSYSFLGEQSAEHTEHGIVKREANRLGVALAPSVAINARYRDVRCPRCQRFIPRRGCVFARNFC